MVDFDALLPHPPLPPQPPELTHFPLPFSQSHQLNSQLEFAVCELVSVKEVCGCVGVSQMGLQLAGYHLSQSPKQTRLQVLFQPLPPTQKISPP